MVMSEEGYAGSLVGGDGTVEDTSGGESQALGLRVFQSDLFRVVSPERRTFAT